MVIKYSVKHSKGIREFLDQTEANSFAQENNSTVDVIEFDDVIPYDPIMAAQLSINKGREIAESMLLELNSRAKAYKHATGIAVGSGLIDLNSKLENYLNKGALEPDAINEIQVIINSGKVDNFLDVYADALIRIDDFLGVV